MGLSSVGDIMRRWRALCKILGAEVFCAAFFQKSGYFLNKKPGASRVFQPHKTERGLALAGFHPRVLFVDHIDPAVAADDTAVFVASFRGFQRVTDLHDRLIC